MQSRPVEERYCWAPVLGGVFLGLLMILTFVISGRGIGISGGLTRVAAWMQDRFFPDLTAKSEYFSRYFAHDANPLDDFLVYMIAGTLVGAFVAALTGRNLSLEILRGPHVTDVQRLLYALLGGFIIGFAARLARGCTSGLALVGGSELAVGSWAFMIAVFTGGFATAWFVRRQWL